MGLVDAFNKIENAVEDLSTLQVNTFTGKLEAVVSTDASAGDNLIDWDKLLQSAKTQGDVQLVMSTKISADGDANLFIREQEIPAYIQTAHENAVKSGQQVRSDIMDMITKTVQGLIK